MVGNALTSLLLVACGLAAEVCAQADPGASGPAAGSIAQEAYLKASNTGGSDAFGAAVAISSDTVVVGAPDEDSASGGVGGDETDDGAFRAGAAYVLVREGTSWSQQAYLKATHPGGGISIINEPGDRFGWSVAISGDTVVVGAPDEDSAATGIDGDPGNDDAGASGAAYVFVRTGASWSQQAYLKASNTDAGDHFGTSVAICGDTIVVGARYEDSAATGVGGDERDDSLGNSGAAYVFVRSGSTWTQQAYLKASQPSVADSFGAAVSISGDTVVVGAPLESSGATGIDGDDADDGSPYAGAAYVFVRDGSTWSQQAYVKASNTDEGDRFGQAVSVSGDTVVVGAPREQSAATGIGGDQADDSADECGAVYVFVRDGATWSQQAYLKASNAEGGQWPLQFLPGDVFGTSVSIDGQRLLVGAPKEDGSATGVNGSGADNGAELSGAAYLFARTGTSWAEQAYLKASNTGLYDAFGAAVAVGQDLLLVGATGESSLATGVDGDQSDDTGFDAGAAYAFEVPPTWSDEGCALAGVAGEPVLDGYGVLAAGSDNGVTLTDAAPSALAGLFVALSSTPTPFKGGTLKPVPPWIPPLLLVTSPAGEISLPFVAPPGVPSATELWLQWAIQDAAAVKGVALSNALLGITP